MRRTFYFFLLLINFSFDISAQSEISNSYLEWGKIKIPINELTNGSNGSIELKREAILDSANDPIFLFINGKKVSIKHFNFFIASQNRLKPPQIFKIVDYDPKDAARNHGKVLMEKYLPDGGNMYLSQVRSENNQVYNFTIKALFDNPPLQIDFSLPIIPKGEIFDFQIHEKEDGKYWVKMDTTLEKNQKILNTYKSYQNYTTHHIPNFKTTRRYLSPKDVLVFPNETIVDLSKGEIQKIDHELISEFHQYNGSIIELKWDELVTNDSRNSANMDEKTVIKNAAGEIIRFQNYDLFDLQDALGGRFFLSQGFQSIPVKRFKLIVHTSNRKPMSYVTDDINHADLIGALEKIEKETMIVFTEIIVENEQSELVYFPTSFLYIFKQKT